MRALLALLTVGLIWQFVLVMLLVHRERGSLRWPVLKDALWLKAPRSPTTGRVGGQLWLVVIPCVAAPRRRGIHPLVPATTRPRLRRLRRVRGGSGVHVRQLGLVRSHRRPERVQHRPRRGAAVPWPAAAADAGCVWALGLGCQRRPVRGLPPARAVADPIVPGRYLRAVVP